MTVTATSCSTPKRVAPTTVAVTVIDVAPSSSPTVAVSTPSLMMLGAASSSVTVTGTPAMLGVVGV